MFGEEEYKKGDSIKPMKSKLDIANSIDIKPMKSISAKESLFKDISPESKSYDEMNFRNTDVEKMNSNSSMAGENGEFQVPITGMRSSNAYFNLGLAARERIESNAKKQGFDSYSDKRSQMKKMTREEKRSIRKNK